MQASIEYVRYLEDCVAKLKAAQRSPALPAGEGSGLQTPSQAETQFNPSHRNSYGGSSQASPTDVDVDVDMTGGQSSEAPSPTFTAYTQHSQQHAQRHPSISPALLPTVASDESLRNRHNSYSSSASVATTTTDHHRHYSYSASVGALSAATSPAFGPQTHPTYAGYAHSIHSASGSTLTSPALLPQRDIDQEATAALLMLNQTDRRGTNGSNGAGRGMSVRDLLST
jgi:hypothetical protein